VNEKLSDLFDPHLGYPVQMKMGDYFDMESDSLGAHLAWANTFNGEQDVYYSYIQPSITIGLSPSPELSAWSIYPNPSNGVFYLSGTGSQANIELFNVHGQLIYSAQLQSRLTTIDLNGKSKGFYFLKIKEQDGSIEVRKLLLQ
jgi:hypothetical protein